MITDTNMTPPETREANAKAFREELAKIQNGGLDENFTENNEEVRDQFETNDMESDDDGDISSDNTNYDKEKDIGDDLDDVDSSNHMIPKGRFNKVIQKNKTLEKELEQARAERIKAQAELDIYNQAMERYLQLGNNQQKTEEEFEPLDTEAHRFYLKQQEQLKQEFQQKIEKLESQTVQNQMRQILEAQEYSFSKEKPDFKDALNYLVETQTKANSALFDSLEDARNATLQQIGYTAQNLIHKGKNVAKTFYDMAKNFGYRGEHNSGPNINAINQNMQKSKVANLNNAPVKPVGSAANLTMMENFNKVYDPRDKRTFHKIIDEIRNAQ